MIIEKLQIAGFRSFENAEFTFQPGMNLLVGVNGVGKTTVLDIIRICLSKVLPTLTESTSSKIEFEDSDIRIGADYSQIYCDFELNGKELNYLFQWKRKDDEVEIILPGLPDKSENISKNYSYEQFNYGDGSIFSKTSKIKYSIVGVFYSTRRSLIFSQTITIKSATGGKAAAFVDSLSGKPELSLRLIALWFYVQEDLSEESKIALKHIESLQLAVSRFLPGFSNLRIDKSGKTTHLLLDKGGLTLKVNQLSDGERGILALVLDLTRRLSQANPELEDPAKDGVGIVLIDELDLHLHPKWQRSVVKNLTRTFQNCQFIASTHSPQIIPTLEPERVQIIKSGEVIHPDRTLGMDSNWILRQLMEVEDRPEWAGDAIEEVEDLIFDGDFDSARAKMAEFRQKGFDFPEWSVFEARIARLEIFDEE